MPRGASRARRVPGSGTIRAKGRDPRARFIREYSKCVEATGRWCVRSSVGVGRVLSFAAWLFAAACAGKDAAAPVTPAPPPAAIAAVAQKYMDDLIEIMRTSSINRRRIDWNEFRTKVLAAAAGAQSIPQTYGAIRVAIGLLDDSHSFYLTAGGAIISVFTRSCFAPLQNSPSLPTNIGYVRVPSFSGDGVEADIFATSLQTSIRNSDRDGMIGWIVDLRGNGGGNMWPMLAGVGPVLGEGIAGHFMDPDLHDNAWQYRDGASWLDATPITRVTSPYRLRIENPRVAVLVDNAVASSGEAIAISFKGRPDARLFGFATCGLSTANEGYPLSDGGTLILTVSTMADRMGNLYGDRVNPEESIPDPSRIVERVIEWLQTGT